jgi:foldase protein PrsA
MKIKKVLALTLALTLTALTLLGCEKAPSVEENVIAIVNDEKVLSEDFDRSFAMIERTYVELYGDEVWQTKKDGKTLKKLVEESMLDSLIEEKLIVGHVKSTGYTHDTADIDKGYEDYMAEASGDEELMKFLEENLIDEKFIKSEIEIQKYIEKFDDLIGNVIVEDPNKLKEIYDTYPIQVDVSHILISKEDKKKAEELLEQISNGADFAEIAKANSIDKESAKNGGNLGLFPRGKNPPEFERAAFSLDPGQISELIESDFGYHIIKVNDIQTLKQYEEAGAESVNVDVYKNSIISMVKEEARQDKIEELRTTAKIEKYEQNLK